MVLGYFSEENISFRFNFEVLIQKKPTFSSRFFIFITDFLFLCYHFHRNLRLSVLNCPRRLAVTLRSRQSGCFHLEDQSLDPFSERLCSSLEGHRSIIQYPLGLRVFSDIAQLQRYVQTL